jgi:16S rRNA (guanine966-N2)-methyltransferase
MRIIAGRHRGRPITAPQRDGLRPTAGRAREAVFNVLMHGCEWGGFEGATVLDVFAGSGAYGLEALSRGATWATFVDVDDAALHGIRRNAAALGEARSIGLLPLDATRLPAPAGAAHAPAALAFLDPPYGKGLAVPALLGLARHHWLAADAIAVVEVAAGEPLAPPPVYSIIDERLYGAARVVFLRLGTVTRTK